MNDVSPFALGKDVRFERVSQLPSSPSRPRDAHKGTFGRALLVAGSVGMSGAACLAGQAALHGGAGLVTVAVPASILNVVAAHHPAYMTVALPDDGMRLLSSAIDLLSEPLQRCDAVAVGPGLGQTDQVTRVVEHLYRQSSDALVLDADGLNALAGGGEFCRVDDGRGPRLLTPHVGEFARLTSLAIAEVQQHRVQLAVQFAAHYGVTVLLKGPETLITDGQRLAVNSTGNQVLAKGGSGDVLTGLLVALLAQGMPVFEAAQLGAYLHGLAGDVLAKKFAMPFPTALELLRALDDAWTLLESV